MSIFFGPLDSAGRVPTRQQKRVAAFLMSCHGAIARQLAIVLASQMNTIWHIELNTQFYREAESVLLLLREEVTAAVESRHGQLNKLWQEVLSGIGIDRSKST